MGGRYGDMNVLLTRIGYALTRIGYALAALASLCMLIVWVFVLFILVFAVMADAFLGGRHMVDAWREARGLFS